MLISVLCNEAVLDLELILLLDTSWKIHLFRASDISQNARQWEQKMAKTEFSKGRQDNPKLHFWFRLTDQQKNLFWIDFEKFSTGDSLCVEIANKGIRNAFFSPNVPISLSTPVCCIVVTWNSISIPKRAASLKSLKSSWDRNLRQGSMRSITHFSQFETLK